MSQLTNSRRDPLSSGHNPSLKNHQELSSTCCPRRDPVQLPTVCPAASKPQPSYQNPYIRSHLLAFFGKVIPQLFSQSSSPADLPVFSREVGENWHGSALCTQNKIERETEREKERPRLQPRKQCRAILGPGIARVQLSLSITATTRS